MKFYMRKLSSLIRIYSGRDFLIDDDIYCPLSKNSRIMTVIACRSRQRLLQQAWNRWINITSIEHDYTTDVVNILSRFIPDDELRTEVELMVIYKWIVKNHLVDPTGLAFTVMSVSKRETIIKTLQNCRLERYYPGEVILIQGELPRPEEGQYTVLRGVCEVVQFPPESRQVHELHQFAKQGDKQAVQMALQTASVLHTMRAPSGFGELSTLVKVRRTSSIRAAKEDFSPLELLVIPQHILLECLDVKHREEEFGASHGLSQPPAIVYQETPLSSSESLEFFRLSGLAHGVSSGHILSAAQHIRRRVFNRGQILYFKGQPVSSVFIVMSGEFLLDTSEPIIDTSGEYVPFLHTDEDNCYYLSSGSILGDEGLSGKNPVYASTAVVVSPMAMLFEFTDYGIVFLSKGTGLERYAALAYKDRPQLEGELDGLKEQVLLHNLFDSLRRAISSKNEYRGIQYKYQDQESRTIVIKTFKKSRRRGTYIGDDNHSVHSITNAMVTTRRDLVKSNKVEVNFSTIPRTLSLIAEHHAMDLYETIKKGEKMRRKEMARLEHATLKVNVRASPSDIQEEMRLRAALTRYRVRLAQSELDETSEADREGGVAVVATFFSAMMDEVNVLEETLRENSPSAPVFLRQPSFFSRQDSIALSRADSALDDIDGRKSEGNRRRTARSAGYFFPTSRKNVRQLLSHYHTKAERYLILAVRDYLNTIAAINGGEINPRELQLVSDQNSPLLNLKSHFSLTEGFAQDAENVQPAFLRSATLNTRRLMERSLRYMAHAVNKLRGRSYKSRPGGDMSPTSPHLNNFSPEFSTARAALNDDTDADDSQARGAGGETGITAYNVQRTDSSNISSLQQNTASRDKNDYAFSPRGIPDREPLLSRRSSASTGSGIDTDVLETQNDADHDEILLALRRNSSNIVNVVDSDEKTKSNEEVSVSTRDRKIRFGLTTLKSKVFEKSDDSISSSNIAVRKPTVFSEDEDILVKFHTMMRETNPASRYQEGKKKAANTSRFKVDVPPTSSKKLLSDSISILSPNKSFRKQNDLNSSIATNSFSQSPSATSSRPFDVREDQFHRDLNEWTEFIKAQTDAYRASGHASLPVIGKDAARATQWSNRVVVDKATTYGSQDHALLQRLDKGHRRRKSIPK